MRKLAVISGKGGTGKTTVAAALIALAKAEVFADCDVDAPNLHLLFDGQEQEVIPFIGAKVVAQNLQQCSECGLCQQVCRFEAIKANQVLAEHCEGCGACTLVCPTGALTLVDKVTGHLKLTKIQTGTFVHSQLLPGEEGTGKLVTEVKQQAGLACGAQQGLIIIDGPPGTGCPVIATLIGCDFVLIVTEATLSGYADLLRVAELCRHFNLKPMICINKYDLNSEVTRQIQHFCLEQQLVLVGKLPFDESVSVNINQSRPLIYDQHSPAATELKKMWRKINKYLESDLEC